MNDERKNRICTEKDTNRESNYDLLRILCTIAVISIHVSAVFTDAITDTAILGEVYRRNIWINCLYNVLPRFAVPCFLMLTGAFLLDDERNINAPYFYWKKFRSLGIPVAIFSILYGVYSLLKDMVSGIMYGWIQILDFKITIYQFLKGAPFYHLWYMTMLIGIYLLMPFLIRFKRDVGGVFQKISWIFLVLASLSYWSSTHTVYWDIGFSFYYLGYVMVGYAIRKYAAAQKNVFKGTVCVLAGIIMLLLTTILRYHQALAGISDGDLKWTLVQPLCPLITVASVCIFFGFSYISISVEFRRLSAYTFLIYLIHAGVWDIILQIIRRLFGAQIDSRIVIPMGIISVFGISLALAILYKNVQNFLRRNLRNEE